MIDLYDEFKLGNKMRKKLKNYTKFVKTTKSQQGCYFIKIKIKLLNKSNNKKCKMVTCEAISSSK